MKVLENIQKYLLTKLSMLLLMCIFINNKFVLFGKQQNIYNVDYHRDNVYGKWHDQQYD